jgi:hypothetical protein
MPTREALARAGSDAALRKALKVRPRQLFLYARHFHVVHDTDPDLGPPDDLPTDELVPLEWLDDDEADINLTAGRGQFEFIETTGWGAPTGRKYTIVAIGLEVDRPGVDALWPAAPVKLEAVPPAETVMPTTSGRPGPKEQKEWRPIVSHLNSLYRNDEITDPNSAFHAVNDWLVDNKKSPMARSTVIDGIKRHWSEITKIDD